MPGFVAEREIEFFVQCVALAFTCVVISGASYWSPALLQALCSLLERYIYLVCISEFFFSFSKDCKEQSHQGYPLKYLLSSGAILMKCQKDKGGPLASLECIGHKLSREILKAFDDSVGFLSGCFQCSQEYEIDKTLGIKGPEDVAKMGIEEYNNQCRGIVMRYSKEWEVSKGSVHVLLYVSNCMCREVFQPG